MQEGPGDLGAEGFGEDPAVGDAMGEEKLFDGGGVFVEGPGEGAGIGEFDEADAVGEGEAEGVDKGPVAVEAGEVDEGG